MQPGRGRYLGDGTSGRNMFADAQRSERKPHTSATVAPEPTGVMPRYHFNQIGEGCAAHGLPTCLCDVIVTEPVAISRSPLMFSELAEAENGHVSARNIVAWAETLLGCFEMERQLVEVPLEDGRSSYRLPYQYDNYGWHALDAQVRADLLWYSRNGFTFDMVVGALPDNLTKRDVAHVRKIFNTKRSQYAATRKKAQK